MKIKTIKHIQLTKPQKRYKAAIKWMLSSYPRASGRSTLLAICFIEIAIQEGIRIKVFDHHSNSQSDARLIQQIKRIILESGLINKYRWEFDWNYFQCVRYEMPKNASNNCGGIL